MRSDRFLGITVLPEYIQSETIDGVLDKLVHTAGATAVAISPYLMEEADEATGNREPPADAGAGAVRLLDRPLFGKRELWVRTAPSFVPDRKLYLGLRYQPPAATELTRRHGPLINRFIQAAHARHLKVYIQVQAAIPPGYRVQFGGPVDADRPRLPDGRIPPRRLAKNGSLASAHIRDYGHALIRDLCQHYPELDGLRFDWPEYPPYFLDSVFLDFGDPARAAAQRLGFDFGAMRRDALALYRKLHGGLSERDLDPWSEPDGGRYALLRWVSNYPAILEWIRFKAALVDELLGGFRRTMNEAGASTMEMLPNAFPPPWTIVSGMDYRLAARHSTAISVKLYTMHWPMILRFYADQILTANPGLPESSLVRALVSWLDISDEVGTNRDDFRLDLYRYPGPEVAHPVGARAQARKIEQAQADAGDTPVYALVHGYGPVSDFRKRLRIGLRASKHGIWVNRWGYLSDEKLETIGDAN